MIAKPHHLYIIYLHLITINISTILPLLSFIRFVSFTYIFIMNLIKNMPKFVMSKSVNQHLSYLFSKISNNN
jgi:hypothetical protein